MKNKILRAIFFDISGNIVSKFLLFFSIIIIARSLGPELLGRYAIIIGFIGLLNVFVTLGTTQGLVRYFGELSGIGARNLFGVLIKDTLKIRAVLFLFVSITVFSFREFLFSLFGLEFQIWLFAFILLYIALQAFHSLFSTFLQTQFQQKYFQVVDVTSSVINLGLIFILYVTGFITVINLLLVGLFLTLLRIIFYVIRSRILIKNQKEFVQTIDDDFYRDFKKRFLKYSLIMFVITFSGIILAYRSDMYFISFYLGLTAVGYYSLCQGFVSSAYSLITPRSFGVMYTSTMVEQYKKFGYKIIDKYFKKNVEYTFLFSLPIAIGGSILSKEIIVGFYGEQFLPAANLLILFFIVIGIFKFAGAISSVFVVLEKPQYFMWTKILSFINIVLNILLIPKFGITGALYSTSLTQLLIIFVEYILAKRLVQISLPLISIGKIFIASLAMGAIVYISKTLLPFYLLVNLFTLVLIGVVFYVALIYYFKIIDEEYFHYLLNKVKSKIIFK